MHYHVSRGGQTYGPYTLADLERYIASGNILPTDMVKSDEMPEWVPVSDVIRPAAPASVTVEYGQNGPVATANYAAQEQYREPYPNPPNLHWGLVLLFDVLTTGLFQMVWNVIVSLWMRRVQPNSRALFYYAAGYALVVIYFWLQIPTMIAGMHHIVMHPPLWVRLVGFLSWVARLLARFSMKSSLEEHYNTVEPIGLRLNGFLVFFFGGLYIQSQLNRINDIKIAMRYRGPVY